MPSSSLRHVLDEMSGLVQALRAHEAGTRAGQDPEHVHEMRVALRSELDWLGAALGLVRDLDVLHAYLQPRLAALEGAEHRAGQRVLRRLAADRTRARAGLNEALDSPRYPRILEQLETFLSRPPASASDVSLPDVAATEWKRLRKAVQKLPGRPSVDELHAVRIKVKRARFAAELARAAAGERGKRFVHQAKKLQDILGDLRPRQAAAQAPEESPRRLLRGVAEAQAPGPRGVDRLTGAREAAAHPARPRGPQRVGRHS